MNPNPLPPMYFGPVTALPSWYWVGGDVAKYIGGTHEVRYFGSIDDIPDGALVFWIKRLPSQRDTETVVRKKLVVVFFPVDAFLEEKEIQRHHQFIGHARRICLHARSLRCYFDPNKTTFVDHFNKYGVSPIRRESDKQTLLWIGGFQYVPYVLSGLHQIEWKRKHITLLTDMDSAPAKAAAERNGKKIHLHDPIKSLADSGVKVVRWSEAAQRALLRTCDAAFDIKYLACFNQYHKPPTKLQKYLASGIPCAVNEGFKGAGQLHGVLAFENLSKISNEPDFHARARRISQALGQKLSLPAIANCYLNIARQITYSRTSTSSAPLNLQKMPNDAREVS